LEQGVQRNSPRQEKRGGNLEKTKKKKRRVGKETSAHEDKERGGENLKKGAGSDRLGLSTRRKEGTNKEAEKSSSAGQQCGGHKDFKRGEKPSLPTRNKTIGSEDKRGGYRAAAN